MMKFAPIALMVLSALVSCSAGGDSNVAVVRKAFRSYLADEAGVRPSVAKINDIEPADTLSAEAVSSRLENVRKLFAYTVAYAKGFNEEHSGRMEQNPDVMGLVNIAVGSLSSAGAQIDSLAGLAEKISFDGTAYGYEVDFTLDGTDGDTYTTHAYVGEDGSLKGIGRASDAASFAPGYAGFVSFEDEVVSNLARIKAIYSEIEKLL